MAKKKPHDLTADEQQEQDTFEANVAADEAEPEPPMILEEPVAKPAPPVDPAAVAAEITALEAQIAALQAKLLTLQKPEIEFPKMVKGRSFKDRAEQDAAGPEFAD